MAAEVFAHGRIGEEPVRGFRLGGPDIDLTLSEYGARILSVHVPDRDGKLGDVVLGHDTLREYVAGRAYFGATCGRFANRVGGAQFPLDGRIVQLSANEGPNHLHGGNSGFDRKIWRGAVAADGRGVRFSLVSPDGEEGYPGTLRAQVAYSIEGTRLLIEMRAETDAPTIVNLVNHTYWNLSPGRSRTIADHMLRVDADRYLPVGEGQIPTGEMRTVEATAFDLNSARRIGDGLALLAAEGDPIGFDHALCLRDDGDRVRFAARLFDPLSGRGFDLSTDRPAVQVYAGGKLGPPIVGKGGKPIARFGGLCLETEGLPNAPNAPHFPSARLDPGEVYLHRMAFRFFVG